MNARTATSGDRGEGLTTLMRRLLVAAGVLGGIAFLQLFVGTESTDRYFAWTIEPPLTAAFLGGTYGTAVVLLLLSSSRRTWAEARIGVLGVLVLTTLVLVAMLIHHDRFHLHSDSVVTFVGTWSFVGTYVVLPPALIAGIVHQLRTGGGDVPRVARLPGWYRIVLGIEGAVMVAVGAALVIAPTWADAAWAWHLTPLTGRAVGAFVFATGIAAGLAVFEDDWVRIEAAAVSYGVLGLLEGVALLRYTSNVDWSAPQSWLYVLFILTLPALGLYGWLEARKAGGPITAGGLPQPEQL
jgi:hypothetical protein